MERGEGLGVPHDEGHGGHDDSDHAARAQLWARDGDAQDVREVRWEDDAMSRDQEDGVRDGPLEDRHDCTTRICIEVGTPQVGAMSKEDGRRERRS